MKANYFQRKKNYYIFWLADDRIDSDDENYYACLSEDKTEEGAGGHSLNNAIYFPSFISSKLREIFKGEN